MDPLNSEVADTPERATTEGSQDAFSTVEGSLEPQNWPSGAVECSFCGLWFSKNTYNIHYSMHPSTIIPGILYLGGERNAADKKELDGLGIKRILNAADDSSCFHQHQYSYLHIPLKDVPDEDLLPALEGAVKWLKEGEEKGEPTLVHCVVGASRSASIVIAYIMARNNITLNDAYALVKSKRFMVRPNPGFLAQLGQYEVQLRGGVPTMAPQGTDMQRYKSLPTLTRTNSSRGRLPPPPPRLRLKRSQTVPAVSEEPPPSPDLTLRKPVSTH